MRTGRALRDQARDERLWESLCRCGHSVMVHRELPAALLSIKDGQLVETPNPAYRPAHFHCAECDCAVTP